MKRIVYTIIFAAFLFCGLTGLTGCSKVPLNIFTIDDDKNLGAQMEAQIAATPGQYPLLDRNAYSTSYAYLEGMKNNILNSGQLTHKDDFVWRLYIIKDDATLNAFCTPGGYIYVYSGLIKYLDSASQLAGVMGHEMAHADQRHSTQHMTEQYGLDELISIALGTSTSAQLAQVAEQLSLLKFSRDHESDADTHSVIYLCPTQYRANGAADFFGKLLRAGTGSSTPVFLSTHPGDESRVVNINKQDTAHGCKNVPTDQVEIADYAAFKASLP